MDNVSLEKKGNILTVKIDLSKAGTKSGSGKTTVIASTRGNQPVPGAENTFIGLNVYKK